ncbi:MAG TPA: hypothetical protein GX700_19425 [Paracoccus sp.]|nr:hypothetical protein [Paracoccus sp. (in: a-proteobacteria)]
MFLSPEDARRRHQERGHEHLDLQYRQLRQQISRRVRALSGTRRQPELSVGHAADIAPIWQGIA